ncbi:hypothetical protein TraAM80_01056 [Trypanosoma rangeli]|uniref:Uncharacterized protein n=1 Tax=Trypanosoma rangeli TaxID=5698 RepID=A0A422P0M8_TRYRA|nr:uncharacterized protein TraAM80_01056 [Trypanosoma rangeli]RNF11267.1 hypothetical protein TraAM80_01056 [Trypanosoma rangeli]|eukprot:RNF11267.1 hypothetical protein TraAM80_01056 [Trypanosoma rangeli]
MLEDTTPRAQLHLQRILNEFWEDPNGTTARARSETIQSSPLPYMAATRCPNIVGSSRARCVQSADPRARHFAVGLMRRQRNCSSGRAATTKGDGSPPRRKLVSVPTHTKPIPYFGVLPTSSERSLRRETHVRSASMPIQRLVRVPGGKTVVAREQFLRELRAGDAVVGEHFGEFTKTKKTRFQQIEGEETFYRQFIYQTVDAYTEALWQFKRYREEAVKQARELANMVARFACASTEKASQDSEENVIRVMKPAPDGSLIVEEALRGLHRMPTILSANYSHLISTVHGSSEAEDPTSAVSIPPPTPQQAMQQPQHQQKQEQPQTTTVNDVNLFVNGLSYFSSRRGSLQAMASRSCHSLNGTVSPHAGLLMSESFGSVDDAPSASASIANMVMRQRGRDADPAWVVEDLQEENVYWQEEALCAVLEAEKYSQMLHTVLSLPPESPPNGKNDVVPRRMSITAIGSPTQKLLLQRLFLRLMLEKEEGERCRMESQEAQEWWTLWFSARDVVTHVSDTLKENGNAVHNNHQKNGGVGNEKDCNENKSPVEDASYATHSHGIKPCSKSGNALPLLFQYWKT